MVILKADKGNALVVLDWKVYHAKLTVVLDKASFHIVMKDPTSKVERGIANLIKGMD